MKILQIAYYYPPMGGAGVQRALKFSKYLPEFGIEPIVLAGLDESYVQDASLLNELPASVRVHRVEDRAPIRKWMSSRSKSGLTVSAASTLQRSNARDRIERRLRDAALAVHSTLRFPDDKAAWARRAERVAMHLIESESIDLVFSSSPPVSVHALAARIAKATGLPWVADFRDLWTDNPAYRLPAWRRAIDRRSEAKWLRQATGVVTVTPTWRAMLAERAGKAARVAFIPNGYDESDFDEDPGMPVRPLDTRVFRIVHTGTFYGPRDPAGLLAGIDDYLGRADRPTRPLRVRLVGNMGARFDASLHRFESAHPGVVERVPYLPHRAALAELMAADALLLVVGGTSGRATSGWLPGKVFEYLRADKPILMLGAKAGDCANLIREHAQAWVVDESEPVRMADALVELIDNATLPAPSKHDTRQFERRRLAGELAEFLSSCAEQSRP